MLYGLLKEHARCAIVQCLVLLVVLKHLVFNLLNLYFHILSNQGKQGPVEHIHKGILFIYDRHHLEHAGFICAKAQSCLLVGGSTGGRRGNVRAEPP